MVPAVCFFLARSACSGVTREIIGGGEGTYCSSEVKLFALRY